MTGDLFGRMLRRPFAAATVFIAMLSITVSEAAADPRDRQRWDEKYSEETYRFGKDPIPFLVEHIDLLPKGQALDVAMGEGRNGVYLAAKGFTVLGIDISERGLQKATALAAERGVTVETQVADLEQVDLGNNVYDLVLCTYYLNRSLIPKMKQAVKSGGMVVMETYTRDYQRYRPSFPTPYLLRTNELLELFRDFTIIRYELKDTGEAVFASIIAQKP